MAHLTFHGAAETVTGSRTLIETRDRKVLIDCGLFQGRKELRQRNWKKPGFDPASIDAVILTHAHIDHSGYLPRLVKEGFKGVVHATPATSDLADIMLKDSAHIQEEDARYANRKGYSKHKPALPLYEVKDAERALSLFEVVDYEEWIALGEDMRFRFRHAGHIVGSGMVEVELLSRQPPVRLLFSGDVGRYDAPLVPDPSSPNPCDVLVIESTYGDRDHGETSVEEQLGELLQAVQKSHGILLVPAFAVGRSQQLIYLLRQVMESGKGVPEMPIHLDSPMAVNATKIYRRYPEEHGLEDIHFRSGSNVLYGDNVYLHRTYEDSVRLNSLVGPRVIISSSGMMTGGRILHHLRRILPHEKNIVVLAGYQAPGTRGWRMKQGEKKVRIHGKDIAVRARLAELSGLSAHADRSQLLRWVENLEVPDKTFVNHGDEGAAEALASLLTDQLNFRCIVPRHGQSFEI